MIEEHRILRENVPFEHPGFFKIAAKIEVITRKMAGILDISWLSNADDHEFMRAKHGQRKA